MRIQKVQVVSHTATTITESARPVVDAAKLA